MKKSLSSCNNCGETISILILVASHPEVTMLCYDCYNSKYANVLSDNIDYDKNKK